MKRRRAITAISHGFAFELGFIAAIIVGLYLAG
jgi:hypothetical protein